MDTKYKTVFEYGEDEIIINKSRFIGYTRPIKTEDEALEFIEEIKTKHRDATHNVYAYVVGENSNVQRFNDDGEPSGTAGIPVLEVIKKEDLRDVVVVVTRYFGGIKLGGGGLIRAYTKGCKIALDAGEIIDMVLHTNLELKVDYTLYGKIENYLQSENYIPEDIDFQDNVIINIYVDNGELEKFKRELINMTSANIEILDLNEKYLPVKGNKKLWVK
jgi:uncharacterized YigZ family protein